MKTAPVQPQEFKSKLADGLRRFPLDFIRDMDPTGGRLDWLEELTRPRHPDEDLSFCMKVDTVGTVVVLAEILPWDSQFFGLKVARLNAVIPIADPTYQVMTNLNRVVSELIERCKSRDVQYLFAPVDARDVALARSLGRSGFEFVESRLFFHRSLTDYSHPERYDVRLATEEDVELLSVVAAEVKNPYDRFHADPVFSGEPADRLMQRWVRASICEGFADGVMVPDVPAPVAFLSFKIHRERWSAWGRRIGQAPFGAVGSEFRGWYMKLISEICYHLKALGAEHFFMVSQATNNAVVRCWEKLGFRYGKSEVILRLVLDDSNSAASS